MARKRKGEIVNGWINLDKPAGITSTQAVGQVRRFLNAQKVGHAGTLDPLATGILPIALGEATKTIPYIQDALKTYSFTITWGEQRDTDDSEGEVINTSPVRPAEKDIEAALSKYIGEIEQIPPQFSAIKVDGQRAYDLARDGETVELKPRVVYIEKLELLSADQDSASFRMACGKGTYVRALARDLAADLGTYGHISVLRREAVGCFTTETAILLDKLEELGLNAARSEALLPLETALDDIPALAVREDEKAQLKNGQSLSFIARPDVERLAQAGLEVDEDATEAVAIYRGKPVAIVEVRGIKIKPVRVLNI